MRGEIISVGTELLLGQIVDTNARYLSEQLAACGVNVHWRITVGDNLERLSQAFLTGLDRAELIIACGGLGPTGDDLTRQALARALDTQLELDERVWAELQRYFQRRGRTPRAHDRRQALLVPGARILPNLRGSAPGMEVLGPGGQRIFLLPGPPNELVPMFEAEVLPELVQQGTMILSRYARLVGIPEARLSELLEDLFQGENPTLAPYASAGELYVRITVRTTDARLGNEQLDQLEARVRERAGEYVYGTNEETLEAVVGRLLGEGQLTLAVAESCTGGQLSSRLTSLSGSSGYFRLGLVAYHDESKRQLLGVSDQLLREHGAVSAEVALAMAQGVSRLADSDYGVGITGIAGPTGATPAKPLGLVYIAVAGPGGSVEEHRLGGDRQEVQHRATQAALVQLWRLLRSQGRSHP